MRAILASALLLVPLSARAAEPAFRNTLTKKEIVDGWILLFDGKTTFGWTSPNGSEWSVVDGMLAPRPGKPGLLVTTTLFRDYELSMDFRQAGAKRIQMRVGCDSQGETTDDRGAVHFPGSTGTGWWVLRLRVEGNAIRRASFSSLGGGVEFESASKAVRTLPCDNGHIALAGNGFIVRNIKLTPGGTKPLFNGKNLSGWKKYEGDKARAKSTFSVTEEGWLHVKDGPGDLQTEGQWDDFVLQLDCKTNGKHLNSGVFFRCLPGQYQMGYEAQVHNGFTDAGKEYTLEVFDPKTHAPKEKREERFTAIDFGTGAIYRRQPARFQASQDNEWF